MPTIQMFDADSSQIHSVGHDPDTNTLAICFFRGRDRQPGPLYHYANVTAADFEALRSAESIGKHFGERIKPIATCPEDVEVMTKIDDGAGVRNEQPLVRRGRLFFFRVETQAMTQQFDMFAAPPATPPAPASAPSEVIYTIVPKGDRFAVDWRCGDQIGVLGGLYRSRAEAESCIEFRKELRAQGIKDPRPWMRIPREGERP